MRMERSKSARPKLLPPKLFLLQWIGEEVPEPSQTFILDPAIPRTWKRTTRELGELFGVEGKQLVVRDPTGTVVSSVEQAYSNFNATLFLSTDPTDALPPITLTPEVSVKQEAWIYGRPGLRPISAPKPVVRTKLSDKGKSIKSSSRMHMDTATAIEEKKLKSQRDRSKIRAKDTDGSKSKSVGQDSEKPSNVKRKSSAERSKKDSEKKPKPKRSSKSKDRKPKSEKTEEKKEETTDAPKEKAPAPTAEEVLKEVKRPSRSVENLSLIERMERDREKHSSEMARRIQTQSARAVRFHESREETAAASEEKIAVERRKAEASKEEVRKEESESLTARMDQSRDKQKLNIEMRMAKMDAAAVRLKKMEEKEAAHRSAQKAAKLERIKSAGKKGEEEAESELSSSSTSIKVLETTPEPPSPVSPSQKAYNADDQPIKVRGPKSLDEALEAEHPFGPMVSLPPPKTTPSDPSSDTLPAESPTETADASTTPDQPSPDQPVSEETPEEISL